MSDTSHYDAESLRVAASYYGPASAVNPVLQWAADEIERLQLLLSESKSESERLADGLVTAGEYARVLQGKLDEQAPLIEKAIRDLAAGAGEVRQARNEVLRADTEARRSADYADQLFVAIQNAYAHWSDGVGSEDMFPSDHPMMVLLAIIENGALAKNPTGLSGVVAGDAAEAPGRLVSHASSGVAPKPAGEGVTPTNLEVTHQHRPFPHGEWCAMAPSDIGFASGSDDPGIDTPGLRLYSLVYEAMWLACRDHLYLPRFHVLTTEQQAAWEAHASNAVLTEKRQDAECVALACEAAKRIEDIARAALAFPDDAEEMADDMRYIIEITQGLQRSIGPDGPDVTRTGLQS